jgi:hypothetical protein
MELTVNNIMYVYQGMCGAINGTLKQVWKCQEIS